MMDIAPALKKEITIFSKCISPGRAMYIMDAFNQTKGDAEIMIQKLRILLINEEGLSEKWADIICNGIKGAALYMEKKETINIDKVTIDDYAVVDNNDSKDNHVSKKEKKTQEVGAPPKSLIAHHDHGSNANVKVLSVFDEFSVLRKYECLNCRHISDGYKLKNSVKKECPICKMSKWIDKGYAI